MVPVTRGLSEGGGASKRGSLAVCTPGEGSITKSEYNLSTQIRTEDYRLCQLVLGVKSKRRSPLPDALRLQIISASHSQPQRTLLIVRHR